MLPALFVSHGAPTFPLQDVPARHFLAGLAERLPRRPRAILVASAHWETDQPTLNAVAVNDTIHDFRGFPRELYDIRYSAPGSRELAERAAALLREAGLSSGIDHGRGLDHGAWVPLRLAFPDADVPVVQVSVLKRGGPKVHHLIGQALAPLRADDVLIVGSGSFTHDLSSFGEYRNALSASEPAWVSDFADWTTAALEQARLEELFDYRRCAPEAIRNHPTEEHLLPLFVALGAGGEPVRHLHASTTHAILRMDVFAFGFPEVGVDGGAEPPLGGRSFGE